MQTNSKTNWIDDVIISSVLSQVTKKHANNGQPFLISASSNPGPAGDDFCVWSLYVFNCACMGFPWVPSFHNPLHGRFELHLRGEQASVSMLACEDALPLGVTALPGPVSLIIWMDRWILLTQLVSLFPLRYYSTWTGLSFASKLFSAAGLSYYLCLIIQTPAPLITLLGYSVVALWLSR